jgi:hypothetical protein
MYSWQNFVFLFLMVVIVIHIVYDHVELKLADVINTNKNIIKEKFTNHSEKSKEQKKSMELKEQTEKTQNKEQKEKQKGQIKTKNLDETVARYSENYLINQSLTKNDVSKFPFVPYNYENSSDQYGTIHATNDNAVDDEMPIDKDGDDGFDMFRFQDYSGLKSYKKFAQNIVGDLPPRHTWCPDFKCQRNYMTCTSKHVPKIQKRWKPDPIPIVIESRQLRTDAKFE